MGPGWVNHDWGPPGQESPNTCTTFISNIFKAVESEATYAVEILKIGNISLYIFPGGK